MAFFLLVFLISGAVFLSYWSFGLRRPALEFAGSWIEPGPGAEDLREASLQLIFPGV